MVGLEPPELVQERVERFIGDRRRVPDVIALLVVPDRGAQLGEAFFGCRGHPEIGQSGGPSSGVPSSSPATVPAVRYAPSPKRIKRTNRIDWARWARIASIMIRAQRSSGNPPTPVPNAGNAIDAR